jgi:hypothetical protein
MSDTGWPKFLPPIRLADVEALSHPMKDPGTVPCWRDGGSSLTHELPRQREKKVRRHSGPPTHRMTPARRIFFDLSPPIE